MLLIAAKDIMRNNAPINQMKTSHTLRHRNPKVHPANMNVQTSVMEMKQVRTFSRSSLSVRVQ